MTDFFASLAARYRGEADVLRPRAPFRFEPVRASLAPADLTVDGAWSVADPQWPPRGASRPGQPDEPGRGRAAGDASQPTAWPEPATAGGPPSAGRRLAHQNGRPSDHGADPAPAADAEGLADGATRAGRGPDRGRASDASAAAPPALNLAASRGPMAERETPPGPVAEREAPRGPTAERETPRGPTAERGVLAERQAALVRLATTPRTLGTPRTSNPSAGRMHIERSLRSRLTPRPEPPGDPVGELHLAAATPERHRAGAGSSAPAQEGTTVLVTIGRVEVQAAAPALAQDPRAATRPAAGPSLADYLRQRSRPAGGPS